MNDYVECEVAEEPQRYFRGRKYCATHDVIWYDDGKCPFEGLEPVDT